MDVLITSIMPLIKYDLYPKRLELRIRKNKMTSSYFSMAITKLILIAILLFFIFEFINVFEHSNVQTNIIEKKVTYDKAIKLNKKNFRIALTIENDNFKLEPDSNLRQYIHVNLIQAIRNSEGDYFNSTINTIPIEFHNCIMEDFNMTKEYFEFNQLHTFLCPDDFNFEISGFTDEKSQKSLSISIFPCLNNSNPKYPLYDKCKSPETISNFLTNSVVSLYIQDNDIDPLSLDNPIAWSLKYYEFYNLNLEKMYYEQKFMNILEVKTDQSVWITDYESIFSYKLTSEKNTMTPNIDETSPFFLLDLISNTKIITVTRNYKKVLDVFSATGGIAKILITIGFFLTIKYNEQNEMLQIIQSNNLELENEDKDNKEIFDNVKKEMIEIDNKEIFDNVKKKNVEIEIISSELKINEPHIPAPFLKKYNDDQSSIIKFNDQLKNYEIDFEKQSPNQNIEFSPQIFDKSNEMEKENKILINHLNNIKNEKENFKFDFLEQLNLLIFSNKKKQIKNKNKVFKNAENTAETFLDITYIIDKLKEIEKLKEVIFDKDQILIFNIISKYSRIKIFKSDYIDNYKEIEEAKKLLENLQINNSSNENFYHIKLLKLIKEL